MNIFVLNENPVIAAREHCDKHVVKMILESGQMLSTAHRMLDGTEQIQVRNGRKHRTWVLPDARENQMYQAVHMNHPCTIWTRETFANYKWHFELFMALCEEYTHRYGKVHVTQKKLQIPLSRFPNNIPNTPATPFRLAMGSNPECMGPDPIQSYRSFYRTKQNRFKMVWTKRPTPKWFTSTSK